MARINVFVSFEYDKDNNLKNAFYKQAKTEIRNHRIGDCSLRQSYPTNEWKGKAREAIRECDIVFVLVGQDTHNAPGVQVETDIARNLGKPIIQILSKAARENNYQGVRHIDDRISWRWSIIRTRLDEL